MTTIPPALAAHLDGMCTTLCHCWLMERRDGTVMGFTDHDVELTIGANIYRPRTGFTQSEARATLGLAADTTEVEAAIASAEIDEADVDAGLYDGARVTTLLVNWQAPAQHVVLRRAAVGRIRRSDGRFVAELEGLAAALDRPNGRALRRRCDAALGDARCGVDLGASGMHGTGSITARIAPMTYTVSGLEGFETGWFAHGLLTFAGGSLDGREARVVDHRQGIEGTVVALAMDGSEPGPGTAFSIVAGCDKRFATCRTKFSNSLNFRGFPHLPGNDAAYRYVTEGAEFDGGALVE